MSTNLLPKEFELLELYLHDTGLLIDVEHIRKNRISIQWRTRVFEFIQLDKALPFDWKIDTDTLKFGLNTDGKSVEVYFDLISTSRNERLSRLQEKVRNPFADLDLSNPAAFV